MTYLLFFFSIFVTKAFAKSTDSPGEIAKHVTISSFNIVMLMWGFAQFVQLGNELGEMAGHVSRLGDMQEAMKQIVDSANNDTISLPTEGFIFQSVSICTPRAKCLISDLNLNISPKMNTLIVGPSGCGKSSILRVMCGLWSYTGMVNKPSNEDIFFIPQQVSREYYCNNLE
jgi:ABC-type uncharacterized transport system fused permease/ATPase subunit